MIVKYAVASAWICLAWALRRLHLPRRWVWGIEDQASMRMLACSRDFAPVPWSDEIYEDDEPADKIAAQFEDGEKVTTRAPAGWRCQHISMTCGGAMRMPTPPSCGHGCQMQPILA